MADRLRDVVWQEELGSVAERSRRLVRLVRVLGPHVGLGDTAEVERAARLAKADLTSNMVREKEFSSLQGLMGMEYARALGEPDRVATAVFEHYLPRFAGDRLPETPEGMALALADKVDALVGCFGVGLVPTGSEDPYALRRQATGLVRILVEKTVHVSLSEAVQAAISLYGGRLKADSTGLEKQVLGFLRQRLQTVLVDSGRRPDIVESVLGSGFDDPAMVTARLDAVESFLDDERFPALLTAFKRACNITRDREGGEPDEALFESGAETELYRTYSRILSPYEEAIAERRFTDALRTLGDLAGPIDAFFDEVMVMAEDPELRRNRLDLLGGITGLFLRVADLSRIEAES
jgi:glycyl-tRNA synthetase beta chain